MTSIPLCARAIPLSYWAVDHVAYCAGETDSLFIDDAELIAVQWKYVIRSTNITPSVTAEKLLGELLKLKTPDNDSLRKQIIALDKKLDELQVGIEAKEREMNGVVYGLYGLTRENIAQVERG